MRFTRNKIKTFEPSFALGLSLDYSSMTEINGKRFTATKKGIGLQPGVLIIHPDKTVQWIGNSFFE